jgi:hypothetical protein
MEAISKFSKYTVFIQRICQIFSPRNSINHHFLHYASKQVNPGTRPSQQALAAGGGGVDKGEREDKLRIDVSSFGCKKSARSDNSGKSV